MQLTEIILNVSHKNILTGLINLLINKMNVGY